MTIDSYAYVNRLRRLHPAEKILFSSAMLLVCLLSPSWPACVAVLLVMALCTVAWAGVRFSFYLRLLSVPLVFLALSVLPILLEAGGAPGAIWDGGFMAITQKSLQRSIQLGARAMGAVPCLYFLSLTTPMVDLIGQLRKWKFHPLLLELMELTDICSSRWTLGAACSARRRCGSAIETSKSGCARWGKASRCCSRARLRAPKPCTTRWSAACTTGCSPRCPRAASDPFGTRSLLRRCCYPPCCSRFFFERLEFA